MLAEGLGVNARVHSEPNSTSSSQSSSSSTGYVPTQAVNLSSPQSNLNTAANRKGSPTNSNNPVVNVRNGPKNPGCGNNPVLFLSANLKRNQAVARTIKLGADDKTTFQALRKEYQNLCARWFRVKHVTGIKFYRVRFFV